MCVYYYVTTMIWNSNGISEGKLMAIAANDKLTKKPQGEKSYCIKVMHAYNCIIYHLFISSLRQIKCAEEYQNNLRYPIIVAWTI